MQESLRLRRTSELPPITHPKWLGIGWVPMSEITVLVGPEGIGKSLLWVRMAAAITTGRALPEMRIPERDPGTVGIIISEDGSGEVRERLNLAGADMDNILWFGPEEDGTGAPSITRDNGGPAMRALEDSVSQLDQAPTLFVVDAWLDTVEGGLQVKDGQQARVALAPWKSFATRFGSAVMLLTHTNRMQGATTRDRMGSTAVLRQKARMTLFADRPEGDFDTIYVGPDKANNTGIANAVRFTTDVVQVRSATRDDPGTSARLVNPSDVGQSIHYEIKSWDEQQRQENKKPSKADGVADEITRLLESRGIEAIPVTELNNHLKAMGFGDSAIASGKRQVGESKPTGQAKDWEFRLNPSVVNDDPMSLKSNNINKSNETEELELNAWCDNCTKPFHFTDSNLCPECENKA